MTSLLVWVGVDLILVVLRVGFVSNCVWRRDGLSQAQLRDYASRHGSDATSAEVVPASEQVEAIVESPDQLQPPIPNNSILNWNENFWLITLPEPVNPQRGIQYFYAFLVEYFFVENYLNTIFLTFLKINLYNSRNAETKFIPILILFLQKSEKFDLKLCIFLFNEFLEVTFPQLVFIQLYMIGK